MSMQLGANPHRISFRIRTLAKVVALAYLALYAALYVTHPFPEFWDNVISNLFLILASSVTAAVATLTWVEYDRGEPPRRIWGWFAAGLWLWAAAELIWGYLNVTRGEVPEGISDLFWISAYVFFAHALFNQYRVLARPTRREFVSRVLIGLLSLLALYLLIYGALIAGTNAPSSLDAAINSFYPAADLLLALTSVWLISSFTGGVFSRPWIGLLAFAFADLMYAWLEISGLYSWSVTNANLWSTVSDVAYLGAYLVLALGLFSHWVFLQYGLRSPTEPH
jgi:hypothetical protein